MACERFIGKVIAVRFRLPVTGTAVVGVGVGLVEERVVRRLGARLPAVVFRIVRFHLFAAREGLGCGRGRGQERGLGPEGDDGDLGARGRELAHGVPRVEVPFLSISSLALLPSKKN